MDQFCAIKNPNYQRCSCSDRIYDIVQTQTVMQEAVDRLTEFTENLDVVGMTAAQARAIKTATEGENALTDDKSAAKALLNAIMNSIRGEDANVGGRFSALDTINMRMDFAGGFGGFDDGQEIAMYNGANLYAAIYGRCREAVRPQCNDASLQRAVTAYLMAIENDCNTVQRALDERKKLLATNVRETDAMLDLARIENRQRQNALGRAACLREVESAILSEQVCGPNYRKCLDNGQFIDVTTGRPFEGVVEFFRLAELLRFNEGRDITDQRLTQIAANRGFVTNFENKTRQFAAPVLDRCTEVSSAVWADFLDKAMLDIFYAQKAKVEEIKTGCMDFVSMCYMNTEKSLTNAMKSIVGDTVINAPDFIATADQICRRYVDACDNMFRDTDANGIIAQYIKSRTIEDKRTACGAVVEQCFARFGGNGFANFYNPFSGIFASGHALRWFTFKECRKPVGGGMLECDNTDISECALQLNAIAACHDEDDDDLISDIFGGFIRLRFGGATGNAYYLPNIPSIRNQLQTLTEDEAKQLPEIALGGGASRVHNVIIGALQNQCDLNYGGRFLDRWTAADEGFQRDNVAPGQHALCFTVGGENDCPRGYWNIVDTTSWGACFCSAATSGTRSSGGGIYSRCE